LDKIQASNCLLVVHAVITREGNDKRKGDNFYQAFEEQADKVRNGGNPYALEDSKEQEHMPNYTTNQKHEIQICPKTHNNDLCATCRFT